MTEIARELLEGIQIDDYVQVRYGTDTDQTEYEGKIVKWSDNLLSLQQNNGEIVKIRLDDNLRALRKVQENTTSIPNGSSSALYYNNSLNYSAIFPGAYSHQIMRPMEILPSQKPYSYSQINCIENAKYLLKEAQCLELKRLLGGVIDSLSYALKNNEIPSKYHNLRAKLLFTKEECYSESDFRAFYYTLGILAYIASDYEYSLEPFVRAGAFSLAAYSASLGNISESAHVFSLCSLLSKESEDISQYTAEICVMEREVGALRKLLEDNKHKPEVCERLASCAMMVFFASGGRLNTVVSSSLSAYDTANLFLDSVPDNWEKSRSILSWWEEFSKYSYPLRDINKIEDERIHKGVIINFDAEKKFGFISPNHYFYISQVYDDSENGIYLRKLLSLGVWANLEIEFQLGKSQTKVSDTAATAIELSEKGLLDAQEIIKQGKPSLITKRGFVERFFPAYLNGRIQSCGKSYKFKTSSIIDPWLKAYYEEGFTPKEQDVTFEANGDTAVNICWLNPSDKERDSFDIYVDSESIDKWESYISNQNKTNSIVLPESDPYQNYKYYDLPDIENDYASLHTPLLTWNGKTIIGDNYQKTKSLDNDQPKELTTQKQKTKTTVFNPLQRIETHAERGRDAVKQGDFEEAEKEFENALSIDGFNEKIVCDLISVLQRNDNKVSKAIEILYKYEKKFTPEKFLDLQISLYDKKKDYEMLCDLYDKAFRMPLPISKKSHYLYKWIGANIRLARYTDALSVCEKWKTFFNQNRFKDGGEKLINSEPGINRQKAICLYHLGKLEEANTIATELVRANPLDKIANGILNGTVESDIPFETGIDDSENEYLIDDNSQMDRFVRALIQNTNLVAILKTSDIKEGRFIGTTNKGLSYVDQLIVGQGKSSKSRSDSLFAACKIIDQLEQRSDETIPSKYSRGKTKYAGRAISSWGDYMVPEANQLDTTRMAYLYALKLLAPTDRGIEQDWANSYNRYIKSFFLARTGNNSLEEYNNKQNISRSKDAANADILVGNNIHSVLLPEFVVGVLLLIEVLKEQKGLLDPFINDLYNKNKELRESIFRQLDHINGNFDRKDDSLTFFKNSLLKAVILLEEKNNELFSIINECSTTILSQDISEEVISSIEDEKWVDFLTATDAKRLKGLYHIIKRSQDYYVSQDFENRADCLGTVLSKSEDLRISIKAEPTNFSYDVLLPALDQIIMRVTYKQTDLYQSFLPKLSWREKIQPFRTLEGKIQIQLTVKNELNYQSADSICINSVSGPDIISVGKSSSIKTLRGGDEVEIGLEVIITDSAASAGSFSAKIGYSYKCNDGPQNVIVKSQDLDFTFIIRNENFKRLENPYSAFEGKVMSDDKMFVGRWNQIQQILDMIHPSGSQTMNYGRAIAMYGQTRTGKSSLMYHLKKKLLEQYGESVLIWDVGNVGKLPCSNNYLANILYTILAKGNKAIIQNESVFKLVNESQLTPPLQEIRKDPSFAINLFLEYMEDLNSILLKENIIIILLIDEFTYLHSYIKDNKIPESFMQFWKALLQDYCVFAIVAGQDDMPEFMREYQNEFACMELLKLNYLDEKNTKKLIKEPLEKANNRKDLFIKDSNDDVIDTIYRLTAGSANLTIILCSKLVDFLNEKGAYIITSGIVDEFLRTKAFGPNGFLEEAYFEPQIQERGHKELEPINKSILTSVARLSNSSAAGFANLNDIECDCLNGENIQKYIDRLVDRNVLVKEGRDRYRIQVKLLELWLINTMGE